VHTVSKSRVVWDRIQSTGKGCSRKKVISLIVLLSRGLNDI